MKNSIISSLLLVMIVSCNSKSTEEKTEEAALTTNVASLTDAQLKNATIEVGSLQKRSISSTLKVNGKIDVPPQNLVSVSMPLGGILNLLSFYLVYISTKERLLPQWKTNTMCNCNRIICLQSPR